MPRVATFCPRCGEAIDTELPEEARSVGRAQLTCPACRFGFIIAPAAPSSRAERTGARLEAGTTQPTEPTQPAERTQPTDPAQPNAAAPGAARLPEATAVRVKGEAPAAPRGALPARLLAAGLLLIFAAALGGFFGAMLAFDDTLLRDAFAGEPGSGILEGRVVGPGNDPLEGVTVELLNSTGSARPDLDTPVRSSATTDARGGYRFDGLHPGENWVRVKADGHRTAIHEVVAFEEASTLGPGQAFFGQVVMQPGDPGEIEYGSQMDTFAGAVRIAGWVFLVAGVFAVMGAVLCFLRRGFPLAVIGAIGGIFTFAYFVGSVVAFIALLIILFSRREFRPLRRPKETWQG